MRESANTKGQSELLHSLRCLPVVAVVSDSCLVKQRCQIGAEHRPQVTDLQDPWCHTMLLREAVLQSK